MSIEFNKVSYIYSEKTPFEYAALHDIDLLIKEKKMTAIIGATGSGKSTLVQHLNALLLPSEGKLKVLDFEIVAKEKATNLKALRSHVGLVFQFPEYQLFEETIMKDLCFGPKNFGASDEEAQKKAIHALKLVGLDESYLEKSPLDLSGGQKRRVAIAGILAMEPDILVLDEPTAGLDPQGAVQMMSLFKELNQKYAKTVLVVTHDMEHVLNYCDEVVVMKKGTIYAHTTVKEFFKDTSYLDELHILPPAIVRVRQMLNERGFHLPSDCYDMKQLCSAIAKEVKHHG